MTDPSFYYAIFKRLQAATGSMSVYDGGDHFADDDTLYLAGGFSLRSTDNKYGIFAQLSYNATHYPDYPALQQYWWPLAPASLVPAENPLWALLNASLMPGPGGVLPLNVTVNTPDGPQDWPIMPQPDALTHTIDKYTDWKEFNTGAPRLIDVFATWITNGKQDDTPRTPPLTYSSLKQTVLKPFGFAKTSEDFPILFIASMSGDDGRRPGDKGTPPADSNHVPAHFWATSQIFLTYPAGVPGHPAGTIAHPPHLLPGEEYYVSAVIGNAGNLPAGRVVSNNKILVACEAQAFNSGMGPVTPPLPALTNLDVQSTWPLYEQFGLGTGRYDIIGFRFNVDWVIAGLKQALIDDGTYLGGISAEEWLNDGHPCVKVLIRGGEPVGPYTIDPNAPPTFDSNPRTERHAAQRNLAPFLIPPLMGAKKIGWKNFIVGQMGSGANQLELQEALPAESFHFYLAMPTRTYERYVAKGGARGFEVVPKVANKPFPDAVILRPTSAGAKLVVAEHAKERFLGMSLGIECDPARIRGLRLSDVSLVQTRHDGTIGGGFTLQLQVTK
jgi:hypothetical protein